MRIKSDVVVPVLVISDQAGLEAKLLEVEAQGAALVILIIVKYDLATYRDFKNAADRTVGMQCVCVTENFEEDMTFRNDLMTNVMMKLNLKFGGVNHGLPRVAEWLRTTMILGGDLIHTGTGAFSGTHSIASIIASVDEFGGKCLGSMRLQNLHKKYREVSHVMSFEFFTSLTASKIMDPDTVEAMVSE